jgi:hypothetical protein
MDSHTHPEISGLHSRVSGVESSVSRLRNRVDSLEKNLLRRVGELQQTVDDFVTEYRRDRLVQNAHNDLVEAELLAIVMSQRFISAAAEKIQGRHQRPASVEIRLGPRQGSFSCATDDESTPDALRRQADDLAEQFAGEIDAQATKQRHKLLRWARRRWIAAAVISGALVVTALVTSPATSPFAILSLGLLLGVLGYAALDRFVLLQARIQSIADHVRREKSEIKARTPRPATSWPLSSPKSSATGIFGSP